MLSCFTLYPLYFTLHPSSFTLSQVFQHSIKSQVGFIRSLFKGGQVFRIFGHGLLHCGVDDFAARCGVEGNGLAVDENDFAGLGDGSL